MIGTTSEEDRFYISVHTESMIRMHCAFFKRYRLVVTKTRQEFRLYRKRTFDGFALLLDLEYTVNLRILTSVGIFN